MIIGLLGNKGSGKDTCGDYLVSNYNFIKYNFANPVKEISEILFNLNTQQLYGNKKEEIDTRYNLSPRIIFQRLGTEFGQNMIYDLFPELKDKIEHKLFWVEMSRNFIDKNKNKNIVICDVRFQHEIDFIKSFNGSIIKLNRSNIIKDTHISECEINIIDKSIIDYNIDNTNSKEELYKKIDLLLR